MALELQNLHLALHESWEWYSTQWFRGCRRGVEAVQAKVVDPACRIAHWTRAISLALEMT